MADVAFSEYLPDQAPTMGQVSIAENVVPLTINSYGPVGDLNSIGSALDMRCQGAVSYRSTAGIVGTFAGTGDKLYKWNGTDWDNVSKVGGYSVADEDQWDFAQFGDYILATNFTNAIQVYQLGVSALFADLSTLGDTPPQARFAETVRDFMFLGRTSDGQNFVEWSAINNIAGWTVGTNQCDQQPLPTGGRIMGIVGGQYAIVFCETAIHRFSYTGDSNIIFQRDEISLSRGCAAEGSIAAYQDKIFFLAWDGFYMIQGGAEPLGIGAQKIDRTFFNLVNQAYLYRISATVDPLRKFYVISFTSVNSTDTRNDMVFFYNWEIGRWSYAMVKIDIVAELLTNVGYTGDNFPTATGATSPDDPGVLSPDSSLLTGSPKAQLGVFGQANQMSFLTGNNLQATISTVEGQITDHARTFVTELWPLIDGGTLSAAMLTRNRLNDNQAVSPYVAQNTVGFVPVRANARFHQALGRVAAGSVWTHAEGFNFKAASAGWR